jgi:hypothetical protein
MIKSRRMRWVRNVTRMGRMGNAYKILIGKPEAMRPLGRHTLSWEEKIKIDPREMG